MELIILTSCIGASLLQNCLAFVLLIDSILNLILWLILIWVFSMMNVFCPLLFMEHGLALFWVFVLFIYCSFAYLVAGQNQNLEIHTSSLAKRETTTLFRDLDEPSAMRMVAVDVESSKTERFWREWATKILKRYGMQIHRDRSRGILGLSQKAYIDKILKRYGMQDCNPLLTLWQRETNLVLISAQRVLRS